MVDSVCLYSAKVKELDKTFQYKASEILDSKAEDANA